MNMNQLLAELTSDEGCVLHEYKDHLGYSTIGIGTLIDVRKGGGISKEEAEQLCLNRVNIIVKEFDTGIPWWIDLTERRQRALINMAYQLGVRGLFGFKKMISALKNRQFQEAARQALDSKWAKTDTPNRAARVARIILEG